MPLPPLLLVLRLAVVAGELWARQTAGELPRKHSQVAGGPWRLCCCLCLPPNARPALERPPTSLGVLQGFPGTVQLSVTYTLTQAGELITEMSAVTGVLGVWRVCITSGSALPVGMQGRLLQMRGADHRDVGNHGCAAGVGVPGGWGRRQAAAAAGEGRHRPVLWAAGSRLHGTAAARLAALPPPCPVLLLQTRPRRSTWRSTAISTWAAMPAAPSWPTSCSCTAVTTTPRYVYLCIGMGGCTY